MTADWESLIADTNPGLPPLPDEATTPEPWATAEDAYELATYFLRPKWKLIDYRHDADDNLIEVWDWVEPNGKDIAQGQAWAVVALAEARNG